MNWKFAADTGIIRCALLSPLPRFVPPLRRVVGVDGPSPGGTLRSWCSGTRSVFSNASFTLASNIGQRTGRSSLYSAGCSLETGGELSWSPQSRCCGGIGRRPSTNGDVGEDNRGLVARRWAMNWSGSLFSTVERTDAGDAFASRVSCASWASGSRPARSDGSCAETVWVMSPRADPEGSINLPTVFDQQRRAERGSSSWPCLSSTVCSGASSRAFASTAQIARQRMPRSSCSAISWPCFAARSPVPASPGPTVPSSLSSLDLCLASAGVRSSSPRRQSSAGTARLFAGTGRTRNVDRAVRFFPARPWS
jgi:hypothetical protein